MTTVTVNGATYSVGRSTWHSDYSSLFIGRNGSTSEICVIREWDHIKENPDAMVALKQLWPSQFK